MNKRQMNLLKYIYKNDTLHFYDVESKYDARDFEVFREDIGELLDAQFVTTAFAYDDNGFMHFTDEEDIPNYSIAKETPFTLTDLGYRTVLRHRNDKYKTRFILLLLIVPLTILIIRLYLLFFT